MIIGPAGGAKCADDDAFSERLIIWYREHGRHDLPWQQERTDYRVWLSEIMLQQTQVRTVILLFRALRIRFPRSKHLGGGINRRRFALMVGTGLLHPRA